MISEAGRVPPWEEDECREAGTLEARTRAWSPNRCASFLAGPDIVREIPPMGTERRRLYAIGRAGLGDALLATWPARMRGKQFPEGSEDDRDWNSEVCRNFGGAVHQDESGGFIGVFGVEPESLHGTTARAYPCIFTEAQVGHLPEGIPIKAGDCAFVGGYQTPPVAEAWFHGQTWKCQPPEE